MPHIRKSKIIGADGRPLTITASGGYQGATTTRRATGWNPSGLGPHSAIRGPLLTLQRRARDADRNNPWLRQALEKLVSNEIGVGIVPRSKAPRKPMRKRINELWARSVEQMDADGVLNFYGIQALAAMARQRDGEVFIRRRPRRLEDGLAVPLQIQLLESDFVPADKDEDLPNGNRIRAGIEFNALGRRVAYHMYQSHPQEFDGMGGAMTVRITAENVIHHYRPRRPGQIRGEPSGAPSMLKAHDFDVYDDAELTRKKTRAPWTGVITRPSMEFGEEDEITGEPVVEDTDGTPQVDIQPGTMVPLLPGEGIELFKGDDTGQGYADFMRQQLMAIAAGWGLPYELLTGDWSKVNDRLVRAVLNEFRRSVEMAQDHLTIPQLCDTVARWWMDAAVMSGALTIPGYADRKTEFQAMEWRPHAWAYVHPEQDINAKLKAIAGGITSRAAVVASEGWDVEDVDEQNAEDLRRAREAGLNYDVYEASNAPSTTNPENPRIDGAAAPGGATVQHPATDRQTEA